MIMVFSCSNNINLYESGMSAPQIKQGANDILG